MPSRSSDVNRAVINLANAHQGRNPDPDRIAAARAALAAAKIQAYIERTLADAPPISDDQRARLARLLLSGGGER